MLPAANEITATANFHEIIIILVLCPKINIGPPTTVAVANFVRRKTNNRMEIPCNWCAAISLRLICVRDDSIDGAQPGTQPSIHWQATIRRRELIKAFARREGTSEGGVDFESFPFLISSEEGILEPKHKQPPPRLSLGGEEKDGALCIIPTVHRQTIRSRAGEEIK